MICAHDCYIVQGATEALCDDCWTTKTINLSANPIAIVTMCRNCGWHEMHLHTADDQGPLDVESGEPRESGGWHAIEGELAVCIDCGALHTVVVDDDNAIMELVSG